METTIFTKVIDAQTLFVFEFEGAVKSPSEPFASPFRKGILTKDGFEEKRMDYPAGAYTRIESLDFESAMQLSIENTARVNKMQHEKYMAEDAKRREQENAAFQRKMNSLISYGKGWYIVDVPALVIKVRGNDGWIDQSVRVLADSGLDAYNQAVAFIENPENFQKNVMAVQHVESITAASIEYIGVLTDEYLLES